MEKDPSRGTSPAAYPTLRGPRRSNAPGLPDETFFAIITRQAIHRGSFASVDELIAAIRTYIDAYNERCEPFTWTKTADEILAKLRPQTISATAH